MLASLILDIIVVCQSDPIVENVEYEDVTSSLLSRCSSAPYLDVSLRFKIDANLKEECAVIAWKEQDWDHEDQENEFDDDCSQDLLTDSHDCSNSCSADSDSADSDSDHKEQGEADLEIKIYSESSSDEVSSASANEELRDKVHCIADNSLQYCFEVDRDILLESSLNALQDMSKCVTNT
jgi:hypothetical protein